MENLCVSAYNDIIVLSSSDDTQDDEVKEPLIKVRSKVGRKVRRLLQNEGIKNVDSSATTFGDRDVYSGGEDSDNVSLIGSCSDNLTVTQFESLTKKCLHPLKSLELIRRVIVVTMMKWRRWATQGFY